MIRGLSVLAAVVLLGGVACAAEIDASKIDRVFPSKFVSTKAKQALADMTLADFVKSQSHAVRGRMLAAKTVCGSIVQKKTCADITAEASCTGACEWSYAYEKCDVVETVDDTPLESELAIVSLGLLGARLNCPSATDKASCTAETSCGWSEARIPKCHMTQATADEAHVTGFSIDPAAKAISELEVKCSEVIGDEKAKCDAEADCEYTPAPNKTSTRRLLGSVESSGATCDMSSKAYATLMATHCPAEFKTMKESATGADLAMMESVAASKPAAPAAADGTSTVASSASIASLVASSVMAATVALLAM